MFCDIIPRNQKLFVSATLLFFDAEMPLTVLTDADVRKLLLQLTKQDILDLQQSLADALHYYSTSTEDDFNGCGSSYQPLRTALRRNDGQTTLFMPASRYIEYYYLP